MQTRQTMIRAGVLTVLVGLGCDRPASPPPVAEGLAPPAAEVFAPGSVSIPDSNVFRGAFTPDGRSFYFFRKVTPEQEDYRIYASRYAAGRWLAPERVDLGGEYSDLYPTISPDGQRLVFTSYRPVPGDTAAHPNANLWYADRAGDRWGPPVLMRAASTLANYDAGPHFGPGGAVYYKSTTPDWRTTHHRVTRWDGTAYGPPQEDETIAPWQDGPEDRYVWSGTLSPDGTLIILDISPVDAETGRRGATDLWVARRAGGGWSEPRLLAGGVNTPEAYENFVVFSPDGRELYFVRDFAQYYHVAVKAAVALE